MSRMDPFVWKIRGKQFDPAGTREVWIRSRYYHGENNVSGTVLTERADHYCKESSSHSGRCGRTAAGQRMRRGVSGQSCGGYNNSVRGHLWECAWLFLQLGWGETQYSNEHREFLMSNLHE